MTTTWQSRLKTGVAVLSVLAVASAPIGVSAVSSTDNNTVTATVGKTITMTSNGSVAIALAPTGSGSQTSASDTVTVSTNNVAGYTLSLKDSDTNANLVSPGGNIVPTTGTAAAPAVLANGEWGYAVPAASGFDASYTTLTNAATSTSKWAGVLPSSGSAPTLKSTTGTATNDPTTVWYSAKVATTQPDGAYVGTVTYTATTK